MLCGPACCSADAYSQGRVIVVTGKLQSAFKAYAPAPLELAEYCHLSSLVVKQVRDQHVRKLMLDKERLVALKDRQLSLVAKLSQICDHDSDQVDEAGEKKSDNQARLEAELTAKGVVPHAFVRVPHDYYERDLEWRRACLSAEGILHLCKSIVMENTKIEEDVPGCPKYCCVIVQYAARLHAEKLKRLMHKQHKEEGGVLGIKSFNMRLAPEEVSTKLTGFEHNAVTPICSATPHMPIVLSHRIAELAATDSFIWLGAGETDLKVGFNVLNFIRAYNPMVVDCTYDT